MSQENYTIIPAPEHHPSFDDQFKNKERITLAGGTAEVIDIKPETLTDHTPIFLATGWAGNLELYKDSIRTYVEKGHRVISLNHPRQGGEMGRALEIDGNNYSHEELRKALNIIDLLEIKNVAQTDAVAHSEGAINLVIAATLYPEKFRNIVLFAPAGLSGKDTFTRLFKDFSAFAFSEKEHGERNVSVLNEAITYILKNPLRALNEVAGISQDQIHELLRYLHEEKHIGIVIIATEDDSVFSLDKIQEIVKADMLDGFLSVTGDHADTEKGHELYMTNVATIIEDTLTKQAVKSNLQKQSGQA